MALALGRHKCQAQVVIVSTGPKVQAPRTPTVSSTNVSSTSGLDAPATTSSANDVDVFAHANEQHGGKGVTHEDPKAFAALLDVLEQGARAENVHHALTELSHLPGALGRAAQKVLASGALPQGPKSDDLDALKRIVADTVAKVGGAEVGAQAYARLDGALTAFRAGTVRHATYGVSSITLPQSLPPAPKLAVSRGFDEAAMGLKLDDEHSIDDVQAYVAARFGRFALKDLIDNGRTIEMHHGARDEAFASLVERGFTNIARVRTPEALIHNELYVAQHEQTGELRYVMAEIWGGTRLGHLQKLLRAAVVDGKSINASQVELHTEPLRRPEEIYRRTSRALLASGTVPASVVVGFKAGVLKELGRRAVAAKRVEFVHDTLGADPARTLMARANNAGAAGAPLVRALNELGDKLAVLKHAPADVFRFAQRTSTLAEVEAALTATARAHPEVAKLLDDVIGAAGFKLSVSGMVRDSVPEGTFIDQTVVTYIDGDGNDRSLLLSRNPYGEIAHELGRVLVDQGVDNVFVFGTAGGLNASSDKIGDLHVPNEIARAPGPSPFDNRAISIATTLQKELALPMKLGGRVANVASPIDETIPVVEELQKSGATIVEMELSHLQHALQGSDVSLSAIYMVSDVPGTDKTIEKQGHNELDRSLQQAVDVLVEGLGMRGVHLVHDPQPPQLAPWPGAMALAERALSRRGVAGDDYAMLRYVVARYLVNGLSDKAIGALLKDQGADPIQSAALSPRWQEKALRELRTPYTNSEVIAHLKGLNAELREAVVEMRRLNTSNAPMTVHITGSVVKGRAGKGSDIDTLLETNDSAYAAAVFGSAFGYRGKRNDDANVIVGDYAYNTARGGHYGPILSLGDGQRVINDDAALVRVWAEAAKSTGVIVSESTDGSFTVRVDDDILKNATVERDTNPIAERLLEHEKTFRKKMNTDFLLKHLLTLSPLADITHVPLERMVHAGELLLRTRLTEALTRDNVAAFLDGPLGRRKLHEAGITDADAAIAQLMQQGLKALPLERIIDGEAACALMGVGDPYDRLTVDLAAATRALKSKTTSRDASFAWFAREITAAQRRGPTYRGPVALRTSTSKS